jgi:galactokinase
MAALGRIMEAGFQSSRDDYQISIPELDRLHGIASSLPGALGTRIAGAGWGGCLVSLLQPEVLDNFMKKVVSLYRDKTGRQASAMAVRLGGGPEEIRAEASS